VFQSILLDRLDISNLPLAKIIPARNWHMANVLALVKVFQLIWLERPNISNLPLIKSIASLHLTPHSVFITELVLIRILEKPRNIIGLQNLDIIIQFDQIRFGVPVSRTKPLSLWVTFRNFQD
jgi:hypothetical protein